MSEGLCYHTAKKNAALRLIRVYESIYPGMDRIYFCVSTKDKTNITKYGILLLFKKTSDPQ